MFIQHWIPQVICYILCIGLFNIKIEDVLEWAALLQPMPRSYINKIINYLQGFVLMCLLILFQSIMNISQLDCTWVASERHSQL